MSKVTQKMNGRAGAKVWRWDLQVYCTTVVSLLKTHVSGQIILILMLTLIPIALTTFRSWAKHLTGIILRNPQHFGEKYKRLHFIDEDTEAKRGLSQVIQRMTGQSCKVR